MTGAERAKFSRINAKTADKLTADDRLWLASHGKTHRGGPVTKLPEPSINELPKPVSVFDTINTPTPATVVPKDDEAWDRVIDATGEDDDPFDDGDDDDDSSEHEVVGSEKKVDEPAPMSLAVSTGVVGSYFLLQANAWSILGNRDPRYLEPSSEESRLLGEVTARYAERWGWTRELDDAILVATILLVSNARAFKAPDKPPEPKPPELKK